MSDEHPTPPTRTLPRDSHLASRRPGTRAALERLGPVDTGGRDAALLEAFGDTQVPRLVFERYLGEGGMGLVRLAVQSSLGRPVAVKTLREERKDDHATAALLREACVTGFLEHPNVIPIHDVGRDEEGRPYIIMKRVEGVRWRDLFCEPDVVRTRFGATDPLEWHLDVLAEVCDAVHFAHGRGLLHRDLKPDNVMIGEQGEVYVLDWGLAVSLTQGERFRHASDVLEVSGTPAYMAPEMFSGDGRLLTARTDVYLLGAILYEILSGAPPRDGDDLEALRRAALAPAPPLPPETPAGLAAIATRALAIDPAERFESVEALHSALRDFLQHRGSTQIAAEADAELTALLDELARPEGEERQGLYRRYGQCRFGYLQALRAWPENPDARRGLSRAAEAMIGFELRHGRPDAAASLLAEFDAPPPELAARVDEARRSEEEERRRGRELDPSIARPFRAWAGVVMAGLWTIGPLIADWLQGHGGFDPSHTAALAATGFTLVVVLSVAWWARRAVAQTAVNRWARNAVLFAVTTQLLVHVGAVLLGWSVRSTISYDFLIWFCMSTMLAVTLERRFLVASAGYLAAFFTVGTMPEHALKMMAVANGTLTLAAALAWPRTGPTRL
jgi:serine/threonine-protein kinase